MPKTNNCCPSKSSSCVENCVKQCREQYCRAKYEKLAKKLIKTGLVQDACNYQADRFLDTVAGGKWNWLNSYLINGASAVNTSTPQSDDLAPAGYGSINAFQFVDETLSNFVFALQYDASDLLNATLTGAGQGIPLVQDILANYYGVGISGVLTAPPGTGSVPSFGSSTLTEIYQFANPTPSENGYPDLATYTQAYITSMQSIISQLPVTQCISGEVGIPLVVEIQFTGNNASNVSIDQVARVGIIKWQSGATDIVPGVGVVTTSPAVSVTQNATTIYDPTTTQEYVYIVYGYTRPACSLC